MDNTKILFTSEEEAEKVGYRLLSTKWYPINTYEKEDNTIECYDGEYIHIDDAITCDWGETYHTDDDGEYRICEHCSTTFSRRESGHQFSSVEVSRGENEDWCGSCIEDDAIYDDDRWDFLSQSRFDYLDWWYDERNDCYTTRMREDCLDGYHDGTSKNMSNWSHLRFWMELEKSEICGDYDDHEKYRSEGWRCEEDWSVEAEYITPILSLDNIDESLDWIMRTWRDIVYGDINDDCGWHIHISTININDTNTYSFYKKVRLFMPLLWAIYPERATNDYCHKNLYPLDRENSRKYQDCTPHSYYWSVEIRIFPWVASEKTMRFRLWLSRIIALHAEKLMLDWTGSYKEIVEFIKNSKGLMEVLSIVYNTPEKIHALVERIIPAYNEAIESNSENYKLTKASAFAKKLEAFVANKDLPEVDE